MPISLFRFSQLVDSSRAEITVYSDRLSRFVEDHPRLHDAAAGYVLAHELAHVMQGVASHSEAGILKAEWASRDFEAMVYQKLLFTPLDIELIHQGLALQRNKQAVRAGVEEQQPIRFTFAQDTPADST